VVETGGTSNRLRWKYGFMNPIAGKTGTALIANGAKGYSEKNYNASFVGYFPANNPKYSCIVIVNRPKSGKIYGGVVAAPVFKEIADKVYATQLDIQVQEEQNYFAIKPFPPVAQGDYQDLYTSLTAMSYAVKKPSQIPEWAIIDSSGASIGLHPAIYKTDTVPDLSGMTAKDAVYMMEKAGLMAVIHGKGNVSGQSLAAGSPIASENMIILTLGDTIR